MIALTQLSGHKYLLNPDLIERVEANPDTTLTMVDGDRYVAQETPDEVLDLIEQFRARVIHRARLLPTTPEGTHP